MRKAGSKCTFSRRDFMRVSAAATAVGAASKVNILAPSVMAAAPRAVAPSDRVRFASIGTGVRGCEDLETAISCGAEMVATCDLYDGRLIAAQEHAHQHLPTTKEYREILDRKDIDFVLVATPDHWHAKITQDAFTAGKDVYCEKPMTHKVEEGFQIIDGMREHNRVMQVGSQCRSSITYAKAREIYQSGALGTVTLIEAWIDRNDASGAWVYPIPPDANEKTIDWNTFLGDAPKRPFDAKRFFRWRCFRDYGEGLPGDLFVHLLTGIYTIAGLEGPPSRALSTGGIFRWKDGRDYPDLILTLYDFPNLRVAVRCNLNNDSAGGLTRIFGTDATLEVRGETVTMMPQNTSPQPEGYSVEGWPAKLRAEYLEQWRTEHPAPKPGEFKEENGAVTYHAPEGYSEDRDHMANFLNAVRSRGHADEDAVFSNWTAIACHMANYSYFNKGAAVWNESSKEIAHG